MDVTFITTAALVMGLLALSALIFYLGALALGYFAGFRRPDFSAAQPRTRFVFIVPAHNEESGIATTVGSLLGVRYPRQLFEVVVIADNCSDKTAARAIDAGARCLQRQDSELRGKGYALRWAFNELLSEQQDAFVVIDADSIVSPNFLTSLDHRLRSGQQVVQSYYGISNPDASILTYLFQVGNLIENKLYWQPKDALRWPVFLRGNGMCFSREVVASYPWDAFSITEDTEYGIMLIQKGIRVHFAPEIRVDACQPETLRQAFDQRVRWAAGNSTLTKVRALRMIGSGIIRADFPTFELGWSLVANSRPLLLLGNLLLLLLCIPLGNQMLLLWSISLLCAQFLYIGLGVALNGFSGQKLLRLILSPFYLGWLCFVSILGAFGFRKNQWVRTSRS